MKDLRKSEWKTLLKSGFKCRYKPVRTVHGRHYFLVDSDYEAYLAYEKARIKSKIESGI